MREPKSRANSAAQGVQGQPFDIERNHAAEQVGFLVHTRAQGGNVKLADLLG